MTTLKTNHRQFIQNAIRQETVWYLSDGEAPASCESIDIEDTAVVMFFSNPALAKQVQASEFQEFQLISASLYDFLFSWLPSLSINEIAVGINWTANLEGLEFKAESIREELYANMEDSLLDRYHTIFDQDQE